MSKDAHVDELQKVNNEAPVPPRHVEATETRRKKGGSGE